MPKALRTIRASKANAGFTRLVRNISNKQSPRVIHGKGRTAGSSKSFTRVKY